MEDDMTCHEESREDCVAALKKLSVLSSDASVTADEVLKGTEGALATDLSTNQLRLFLEQRMAEDNDSLLRSFLVSLGDLGRKDIRHQPGDAGTTKSFEDAKDYLEGFSLPYDLVTGNHDLEGLDEFNTDEENLEAFMKCFNRDTPYFKRQVGPKTLLIGLSTTRFRSAPFSSHEVHIPDEQIEWFLDVIKNHSNEEGWRICVFSHAPIMGSGLRVLQNVHVQNGCAWLNHCSSNRDIFIKTVKENPQIKLWFSGHFHLSHDYQDAISTVGSCTFVQAGVVGKISSRDGRRQTRIVQGSSDCLRLYTINHHKRDPDGTAELRLDAKIDLMTSAVELCRGDEDFDHDNWFRAYVPEEEDGCYLNLPDGQVACSQTVSKSVCWWHMKCGSVLGLHEGQLIEYDASTLSPLGLVVDKKTLRDREVLVVEEGTAVVLVDPDTQDIEVVHPNDDGSYWRRYQRNKRVRQEEKLREKIAKEWLSGKITNK